MSSSNLENLPGPIKLVSNKGRFTFQDQMLDQKSIEDIFLRLGIHGDAHSIIVPDVIPKGTRPPKGNFKIVLFSDFLNQKLTTQKQRKLFESLWMAAIGNKKKSGRKQPNEQEVNTEVTEQGNENENNNNNNNNNEDTTNNDNVDAFGMQMTKKEKEEYENQKKQTGVQWLNGALPPLELRKPLLKTDSKKPKRSSINNNMKENQEEEQENKEEESLAPSVNFTGWTKPRVLVQNSIDMRRLDSLLKEENQDQSKSPVPSAFIAFQFQEGKLIGAIINK